MNAPNTAFHIEEFSAVVKNTLRGFVRVRMPSGMIIADITVHERDGRAWASPPAKQVRGPDGLQMRGPDGKALWTPIVSFASREARDRWSEAVLAAVRAAHPEAFDELALSR